MASSTKTEANSAAHALRESASTRQATITTIANHFNVRWTGVRNRHGHNHRKPAPIAAAIRLALAITPNPVTRPSAGGCIANRTIAATAVAASTPAPPTSSQRCRRGSSPTPCIQANRNTSTLRMRSISSSGRAALVQARLSVDQASSAINHGISGRRPNSRQRSKRTNPKVNAGRYRLSTSTYW